MDIRILNPLDFPNWDNMIAPLPGASFFHTAAWARVLSETYRYKPAYFTLFRNDGIVGLLPFMEIESFLTGKRGVSLPFTDYCQPRTENEDQFRDMLDAAINFGKRQNWKYLEIRGGEEYFSNQESFECYYGHMLDLTAGPQKIYSNLRDSTRRNIHKARKEKVSVAISTSLYSMKEFCRLNAMTRRGHGLPPQPFAFFRNVCEQICTKGLGFIAAASIKNKTIAANIFFHFGNEVVYKYGASDNAFQHLRANNLVMWEAIQWSIDHGFEKFSFGRTEAKNSGLRQFKSGWGNNEYLIKYYKHDLRKDIFINESSSVNPFYNRIICRLPLPVLNTIGRILYRHVG